MSQQDKVELARTLGASGSPINKSQLARVLGLARSSLYVQCKRPKAEMAPKKLRVIITCGPIWSPMPFKR